MTEKSSFGNPNPDSSTLFSCCVAFILAFIYGLFRLGFDDLHLFPLLKTLGVSFLLLCSGRFVQNWSKDTQHWRLNDSFCIICTLVVLTAIGMLMAASDALSFIGWIVSLSGHALLGHFLLRRLSLQKKKDNFIIVGIAIIFANWVGSIFWGYGVYSPLYFESFAVELPHVDTLFHISLAEMIKTYGVPSVGIEGLTYFPYHYGSHFLFAQLSLLLNMDLTMFYPMAVPIIFLPLFFKIYLQFIYTIREKNIENSSTTQSAMLFWLIFLWGFIGLVGFNYLNKAGAASYAVLLSESYTLSLILFFIFMDLCLRFWRAYSSGTVSSSEIIFFVLFVAPCLLVAIGFAKVSTMYIVLSLAGYTFFRLKLFRDVVFIFSFLITGALSLCLLFLTYQFNKAQGELDAFHYLKTYIDVPMVSFFILFYWWIFALGFLLLYKFKSNQLDKRWHGQYFTLELALIAAVSGFLPSAFLKIHGGSASYFMEPQYWLALAFTLSCLSYVQNLLVHKTLKRKIVLIALFSVSLFFISQNFMHHYKRFGYKNLAFRKYMTDKTGNLAIPRREFYKIVFPPDKTWRENVSTLLFAPQQSIRTDEEFVFFKSIFDLRRVSERAATFLFIENKNDLHSDFPCSAIPLAITALSGMATLHGIPYDYCPATDYGFDQQPLEPRTEIGKLNRPIDLCAELAIAGMEKLVIMHYKNRSIDSLQFFHCGELTANEGKSAQPPGP